MKTRISVTFNVPPARIQLAVINNSCVNANRKCRNGHDAAESVKTMVDNEPSHRHIETTKKLECVIPNGR